MASGRTISASLLTRRDGRVIGLCESISNTIGEAIADGDKRLDFVKQYGKIHTSRDGGVGLGAGKLQRDALCTRGRTGKAPFSNRNLRWHPLVVAENKPPVAKEIERIELRGRDERQILTFVVKGRNGREVKVASDKAHELTERFVALPKHWMPHLDALRHWSDTLWTQNSCVIAAQEAYAGGTR